MTNGQRIQNVFTAPEVKHGISLFTPEELSYIESLISEVDGRLLIECLIRGRSILAKPEEIVRQLWINRLLTDYSYPRDRIDVERVVYFGSRDSGLADIVVLHEDLTHPYIIFEVKRPKRRDGLEQLKSYCNAEGAPIGVWSNGNEMIRLHREEPNIFVEIPRVPRETETLRDILTERWTIQWLEENDELRKGKTTLKNIILDLEELVLGNAGVDPFEEIFKLIYAKLYDEWKGINNAGYQLEFFVGDRSPGRVKRAIGNLLDGSVRQWSGVFEPTDTIELRDDHLKVCVSFLEKVKLFNSNLRIIDEAFEYLIPQVSKKKEGQFFTPRVVEDMIVEMLNPKHDEFVVDPACGSAGFLLHSVMWVAGGVITGRELPPAAKSFAQNNIIGIDFAKRVVKIAKAINLIVGDGKSHIYKDNSLAPHTWSDETKTGLRPRLQRFPTDPQKDRENSRTFLHFDFDILMTNPPFAGTVKERPILRLYELSEKDGRLVGKVGRHILFLNRSLQFIRPGGRMAIVLPQGLLSNTRAEYIRRFVIDQARILAVVGLHVNTFQPHTGTKTSVLFLQKYTNEEREMVSDAKAKYEAEWEDFFTELGKEFEDVDYDSLVDDKELPQELKSFIETYFVTTEELQREEPQAGQQENIGSGGDKSRGKPIETLVSEMQHLRDAVDEKLEEIVDLSKDKKAQQRKEIRILKAKIRKLHREVSKRTLGGQVYLVLNERKTTGRFRKFWVDGKVIQQVDYPLFFGANRNPVKDSRGEYRYKKGPSGEVLIDEDGHPIIDHDLDSIAQEFVEFAKEQDFDFWKE